jgi:hypothetical protein
MDAYLMFVPEALRRAAYLAAGEAAWDEPGALDVIRLLSAQDISIQGLEVWLATDPGPTIPTPYIYEWAARKRATKEPWGMYVQQVNAAASDYVRSFAWDPRDVHHQQLTPYFNLAVGYLPDCVSGAILEEG